MTNPEHAPPVASTSAASDATATLPTPPTAPPPTDFDGGSGPGGTDGPGGKTPDGKGGEKPPREKKPPWRIALEWVVLIGVALAIAFLIKTFLFQAFYIPSASMEPTLNIGDRVLVNKLSYDFHDVNRGDIVVFEAPESAQSGDIEDLVKRVVGLPGETVTADEDGSIAIDGRRLREPYLPTGTTSRFSSVPPGCGQPTDGQNGCVVPEGSVFMMGDNREFSKDSRFFGPIAEDTIVGRVFVRIWPVSDLGFL